MATLNYSPYSIKIDGVSEKLEVVSFSGKQKLSSPFEFEFYLKSKSSDIKLNSLILKQTTLTMKNIANQESYISGICIEASAEGFAFNEYGYRLKVVPNLYKCSFNVSSRVYQQKSIKQIIADILSKNSIDSSMYEIKLAEGSYEEPLDYVCQYNESDLNFISRWMESVGIYYYFEFGDGVDKLVITDSKLAHKPLKNSPYVLRESNDLISGEGVALFKVTHRAVVGSFKHSNFDPVFNNMKNQKEADITKKSPFEHNIFGGNAKLQKIVGKYGNIEAERLKCGGVEVDGISNISELNVGFLLGVKNSPLVQNSDTFLVSELYSEGDQSSFFMAGSDGGGKAMYKNSFKAIPSGEQFRPGLNAQKPIFSGVLSATIDGEAEKTPFLDEEGRYKVKMPFDSEDTQGGKASCWIRMMQPSAANGSRGFHFSLLKGDEVLILFQEGDIDRPVIAGAINSRGGVVGSANLMIDGFKTLGGHEVMYDNTPGKEMMMMKSGDGSVIQMIGKLP